MNPTLVTAFLIMGGLGLFIFGMKMMSSGIELIAGDRMQSILQKATSNRFLAVFIGIFATIAINSSTAVTIMTVSFVNSGMLTLKQAIGVIMGANVGTTFSAQLVAFRIDTVAPLFIFVGVILYMFAKSRKVKNIGYVILGFGILFFGVTTMGTPLRDIGRNETFQQLLILFENPILAILAGFVFTAVVQSSSATMGLLVTMHLAGVPIPFHVSAFIVLGVNIGTSITTLIASIPANRDAKRAALFHIMFDIIGTLVFGTLIYISMHIGNTHEGPILGWFTETWYEPARQVAMFHTLYNFATMFLLLPFTKYAAKLMEIIIPVRESANEKINEKKLLYLDTKMQQTPSTAVYNAELELTRMGNIANQNLALAIDAFFEQDASKVKKTEKNESVIDYLNHRIAAKLVGINSMALSRVESEKIGKMFKVLTDIERIGDHAVNIANYLTQTQENGLALSPEAMEELKTLANKTVFIANESLLVFEQNQVEGITSIKKLEKELDQDAAQYIENHLTRLKEGLCKPESGVIFSDMIVDFERCADHAKNIAQAIALERKWNKPDKPKIGKQVK